MMLDALCAVFLRFYFLKKNSARIFFSRAGTAARSRGGGSVSGKKLPRFPRPRQKRRDGAAVPAQIRNPIHRGNALVFQRHENAVRAFTAVTADEARRQRGNFFQVRLLQKHEAVVENLDAAFPRDARQERFQPAHVSAVPAQNRQAERLLAGEEHGFPPRALVAEAVYRHGAAAAREAAAEFCRRFNAGDLPEIMAALTEGIAEIRAAEAEAIPDANLPASKNAPGPAAS